MLNSTDLISAAIIWSPNQTLFLHLKDRKILEVGRFLFITVSKLNHRMVTYIMDFQLEINALDLLMKSIL